MNLLVATTVLKVPKVTPIFKDLVELNRTQHIVVLMTKIYCNRP